MHVPFDAIDLDVEPGAGLSGDQSGRPGARQGSRPVRPHLDSGPTVGRNCGTTHICSGSVMRRTRI
jgi:hypothetical protein